MSSPATSLQVFETDVGRIGILICYDSEFPLLGRRAGRSGRGDPPGALGTEALAGFTRVRVGAMARALEGQMVSIHAPVVGDAPWCYGMEENTGRASIYGPPDRGFPATGIFAEGEAWRTGLGLCRYLARRDRRCPRRRQRAQSPPLAGTGTAACQGCAPPQNLTLRLKSRPIGRN